jgi:hypothetical protein
MRYIKTYEQNNSNNTPKVGDYIVVDINHDIYYNSLPGLEKLIPFISNNIGKIKLIVAGNEKGINNPIYVQYYNIPERIKSFFHSYPNLENIRIFSLDEYVDNMFFSKNIKDVKDYINLKNNINKYNL